MVSANQRARWAESRSKLLRGAIGWKLNRDGISQSEPVSTGCELVAWERRGGAGTTIFIPPRRKNHKSNELISESRFYFYFFVKCIGKEALSVFRNCSFGNLTFLAARHHSLLELDLVNAETAAKIGNLSKSTVKCFTVNLVASFGKRRSFESEPWTFR